MKISHSKENAGKSENCSKANTPRKCNMGRQQHDRKEARIGTTIFVKVAVQC